MLASSSRSRSETERGRGSRAPLHLDLFSPFQSSPFAVPECANTRVAELVGGGGVRQAINHQAGSTSKNSTTANLRSSGIAVVPEVKK
jgi:hypothetical protein